MEIQQYQPNTHPTNNEGSIRVRVTVQPDDVQVKRVGRASCIEPDIKVLLEADSLNNSTAVTLNAYLKVLGKDNKHKLILLRKSDEVFFNKAHRREIVTMKLRFLKTIKVQVLKRNLGVTRPEASIIIEAVNRQNEVLATTSTTHFAIISDPRYLDEVKKRRAQERFGEGDSAVSSDEYEPPKHSVKRRRVVRTASGTQPRVEPDHQVVPVLASGSTPSSPDKCSPSLSLLPSPVYSPVHVVSAPLPTLKALKDSPDYELSFADSDEEEYRLIKLIESLKHKGCNFHVLPPETHAHC